MSVLLFIEFSYRSGLKVSKKKGFSREEMSSQNSGEETDREVAEEGMDVDTVLPMSKTAPLQDSSGVPSGGLLPGESFSTVSAPPPPALDIAVEAAALAAASSTAQMLRSSRIQYEV